MKSYGLTYYTRTSDGIRKNDDSLLVVVDTHKAFMVMEEKLLRQN